jgi:hypothetical protein
LPCSCTRSRCSSRSTTNRPPRSFCDLQHLVDEREVGHARRNSARRFGRLVFLLLDQLLPADFVGGLILGLCTAMDKGFRRGFPGDAIGTQEPFAMDF